MNEGGGLVEGDQRWVYGAREEGQEEWTHGGRLGWIGG
jgi:hypothetical protein